MENARGEMFKKILVVGAGAVGGYFGGVLFREGVDVTFLVREHTFKKISKEGLKIISPMGDFIVHPPLIQDISETVPADLIILAVKCNAVADVLHQIAPWVEQGAVVLTLQNGVGTEDQVIAAYHNPDCILAGVAFITSRLEQPGVIVHSRRGIISIGELSGEKSERAAALNALFKKAGIECRLTSDIRRTKWEKLCWNATFNPLSVILDAPISLVLDNPHLLQVVREGIQEVISVAASEGVTIQQKIIDGTIAASQDLKGFYTSMYEDFRNGKETEIEFLNGDIVRRGQAQGVLTPVHKMLYAMVKGLEMKQKIKAEGL